MYAELAYMAARVVSGFYFSILPEMKMAFYQKKKFVGQIKIEYLHLHHPVQTVV